jgi:hypothetical protein
MSTLPYPPSRPLSVGETLDLTFRIYRATLFRCLPLAAIAVLASQLPSLYLLLSGRGLKVKLLALMQEPTYRVVYVVSVLLTLVLNAAILLRQYHLAVGQQAGGELATAVRRSPALLGMVVLVWLGFMVCVVPGLLLSGAAQVSLFLALAVLACYVLVSLSVSLAIFLFAPAGPVASLNRSWRLTRGSFWRLSIIYTVAFIILVVLYLLLGTATGFVIALAAHGDLAVMTAAYAVVVVALGAFAVPFYMAVQLAVFGDLTARREGADLAQRISATA